MKQDRQTETEPTSQHPDADLIRACIHYSANRRAGAAAYELDPTADNIFAGEADEGFSRRMDNDRDFIARTHPRTVDGLRLKAAVVDMIVVDFEVELGDWGIASIFRSFANDVLQFHNGDRG